jgi:DNA-binding MarR family transcriptional regulator
MLRLDFDRGRATWPLFLRSCMVLMDRIDRQLQEAVGLPLSWFEVLSQLASQPRGMMPMRQLADSVCLTKSGASRLVDRLVEAKLVRRAACQEDGRVIFACLTSRGRSAFEEARPVAYQGVEEHFARYITPAEAEVMAGALMRVLTASGCAARWEV